MGLVSANLIFSNPVHPELLSLESQALVDPGALHLGIPQQLALQLKLKPLKDREVTLADGSKQLIPYAGPIQVKFQKSQCICRRNDYGR